MKFRSILISGAIGWIAASPVAAAVFDFTGTVESVNDGSIPFNPLPNLGPLAPGDAVFGTVTFDESGFSAPGRQRLCSTTSICTSYDGLISSFTLGIDNLIFSLLDPTESNIVLEDQGGSSGLDDYAIFSSSVLRGFDNAIGPSVDGLDPFRVQFGVIGDGSLLADESGFSLTGLQDLLLAGTVTGAFSAVEFSDGSDVRYSVSSVTPGQTPTSIPEPVSLGLFALGALGLVAVRKKRSRLTGASSTKTTGTVKLFED